jgi:hypothetical protein
VTLGEDGEGLLSGACVVAAFCGLDRFACFYGCEMSNSDMMLDRGGLSVREQSGEDGDAPFVFEVAGSSVAVAVTASAQTVSREGRLNML